MTNPKKNKPGPDPETLKAEGADWEDAVAHALNKPRPKSWAAVFGDREVECESEDDAKAIAAAHDFVQRDASGELGANDLEPLRLTVDALDRYGLNSMATRRLTRALNELE